TNADYIVPLDECIPEPGDPSFYQGDPHHYRFYEPVALAVAQKLERPKHSLFVPKVWAPSPMNVNTFSFTPFSGAYSISNNCLWVGMDNQAPNWFLGSFTKMLMGWSGDPTARTFTLSMNPTGHGYSPAWNLLQLTGTNTIFEKPIFAQTNIAPFTTVDNPTNSYQNPNPVFVFTNGNYRTLITGSAVLQAINGVAKLDIQYTNNGVGYVLPLELISTGLSMTMPFSFPLSPGGTFQYNTVLGANSSVGVTNVVGWIQ